MTGDILHLLDTDPAAGIHATADLMEARASAASGETWTHGPHYSRRNCESVFAGRRSDADYLAMYVKPEDAEHIAAADPEFTRAVAAWLHDVASLIEDSDTRATERTRSLVTSSEYLTHYRAASEHQHRRALATCRAYLSADTG